MNSKILFPLALIVALLSSCDLLFNLPSEKQNIICESNCQSLNMHGSIIDKTSNNGIKGIQVTMNWTKPACIFCSDNIIDKKESDISGNFAITNSIDTSFFHNGFYLFLSIPNNNDYIVIPWGNYIKIFNLADSTINNVKFELYPKVQLKIITERIQNDNITSFIVEHYFCKDVIYADIINSRGNAGFDYSLNDTHITETSANIKTFIKWTKLIGNEHIVKIDSIICQKGKENIFTIKY